MNGISFARTQRFAAALVIIATLVGIPLPTKAQLRGTVDLRNGDRVVLIGDTLIEREQLYGYVEERLTVQFPERNVEFRNLGWSADTPAGESRASFDFDKPGKGFEHIKEQITIIQPTVVLIGYGMASSFKGEAGIVEFKEQMNKLIEMIQGACTNKSVRFILLTPIRHENLGAPLPDPTEHNRNLSLYSQAIQGLAAEHKATYISLFDNLLGDGTKSRPPRAFTDDGIHLTAFGYLRMAEAIEKSLVWEPNLWRIGITAFSEVTPGNFGTKVSKVERTGGQVTFDALDEKLPPPVLR